MIQAIMLAAAGAAIFAAITQFRPIWRLLRAVRRNRPVWSPLRSFLVKSLVAMIAVMLVVLLAYALITSAVRPQATTPSVVTAMSPENECAIFHTYAPEIPECPRLAFDATGGTCDPGPQAWVFTTGDVARDVQGYCALLRLLADRNESEQQKRPGHESWPQRQRPETEL